MLQIVLIRPGATDFDRQGRIQGSLDIPLSSEGASEVEKLCQQLKPLGIEVLYCSACQTARETGEALARELGVKLKPLDKLKNLDHGLWQGMLIDEVKLKQPKVYRQWQEQPESVCPPQGEMLSQARERLEKALDKLRKKYKEGVVGLVLPEPLASLARANLVRTKVGDLWRALGDHGAWEPIEVAPRTMAKSG